MTRPTEPEVTIQLDKPRVMRMDLNAIALVEEHLEFNLMTDEIKIDDMSASKLIRLLWCFLVHEDESLTLATVGRSIHPGNMTEVFAQIGLLQERAVGGSPKVPQDHKKKAKALHSTG